MKLSNVLLFCFLASCGAQTDNEQNSETSGASFKGKQVSPTVKFQEEVKLQQAKARKYIKPGFWITQNPKTKVMAYVLVKADAAKNWCWHEKQEGVYYQNMAQFAKQFKLLKPTPQGLGLPVNKVSGHKCLEKELLVAKQKGVKPSPKKPNVFPVGFWKGAVIKKDPNTNEKMTQQFKIYINEHQHWCYLTKPVAGAKFNSFNAFVNEHFPKGTVPTPQSVGLFTDGKTSGAACPGH